MFRIDAFMIWRVKLSAASAAIAWRDAFFYALLDPLREKLLLFERGSQKEIKQMFFLGPPFEKVVAWITPSLFFIGTPFRKWWR